MACLIPCCTCVLNVHYMFAGTFVKVLLILMPKLWFNCLHIIFPPPNLSEKEKNETLSV